MKPATRAKRHWPWQTAECHFYLALPLRPLGVGCKCKINLSAYKRCTIDCWIPPIQNTQIDHAEVARCTLSVSCSTDLDHCLMFVDRVSVFLEHVHRTFKVSKRFTPNFPLVSLSLFLSWPGLHSQGNVKTVHTEAILILPQSAPDKSVSVSTFLETPRVKTSQTDNNPPSYLLWRDTLLHRVEMSQAFAQATFLPFDQVIFLVSKEKKNKPVPGINYPVLEVIDSEKTLTCFCPYIDLLPA